MITFDLDLERSLFLRDFYFSFERDLESLFLLFFEYDLLLLLWSLFLSLDLDLDLL